MSKTSSGIRTIALRIAGTEEAKNEIADLGEDIDDFVVRTKSKTDQIVKDYTAVASNNFKGISVLDDNGNLRDTYDILLDIADIYKEIQETDKKAGTNRAQGLVETLAGKNRSNILASILQNPDLLRNAYETSVNGAGFGQKELDVYLDSVEAKLQTLQNRIQELAAVTIDSEWLKDMIELGSSLITIVTKIVDTFGGLPAVIGSVVGAFMQIKGLGILNFDKYTKSWNTFFGKFKGYRTTINRTAEDLKAFTQYAKNNVYKFDETKTMGELFGENNIISRLQSLKAPDGFKEWAATMDQAKLSQMTYNEAITQYQKSLGVLPTLFGKAKNAAVGLVSTLGTMAISMAATFALSKIWEAIDKNLINARKYIIEEGKQAQADAAEARKAIESATKVNDKATKNDRYTELRKGVHMDRNVVENISLTNEEYEEFLSLNKELAEAFPSAITGFTKSGEALVDLGENADVAKQKLKEMFDVAKAESAEDIQEGMPDIVKKIKKENDTSKSEISDLEMDLAKYEDYLNNLRALQSQGVKKGDNTISLGSIENENAAIGRGQLSQRALLIQMLEEQGIDLSNFTVTDKNGELFGNINIDEKQIESLTGQIETEIGKAIRNIGSDKNKIHGKQMAMNSNWLTNYVPNLLEVFRNSYEYNSVADELEEIMGDSIDNIFMNLDYDSMYERFKSGTAGGNERGDFTKFIIDDIFGNIDDAIDNIDEKDKVNLNKVFNFELGDLTNEERHEILDGEEGIFTKLFPDKELRETVMIAFDYAYKDEDGKIHYTDTRDRNRFFELIGGEVNGKDHISNGGLADWDKTTELDYDQYMSFLRMYDEGKIEKIGEGVETKFKVDGKIIDTWEELEEVINRCAEAVQPEAGKGVLSSVFEDKGFSDSASKIESKLSSMQSALNSFKENSKLTSEELTTLFKSVPELAEFGEDLTIEDIGSEMAKNIVEYTKAFNEAMERNDLSDEAKSAAQNYLKVFWDQMAIIPQNAEYAKNIIRQSVVSSTGTDIDSLSQRKEQLEKYNEFMDALKKKYGDNVDWSVVMSILPLIDPDGEVSDWMDEIESKEIKVKVIADLEDAKKTRDEILERQEGRVSAKQAEISAKEANNERITEEDYNEIVGTRRVESVVNKNFYDKAETAYNKALANASKYTAGEINQLKSEMNSAKTEWQNSLTSLAEAEKQAREANLNYLNTLLSSHEAVGAELERQKTLIEQDGREMKEEFAQELATNRQKQIATQLAIIAENDKLYKQTGQAEYLQNSTNAKSKINDIRASGTTAQEIISQSQVASLQVSMTELEQKATAVEDAITLQEGEGLKPTINQYNKLIDNGKNQIQNLEDQNRQLRNQQRALINQQGALARNSAKWREISAQIKANNSAISQMNSKLNKWKANLKSLGGDIGSSLLSSLQAAFDESISPTGLQYNTMKELAAQFEGIEGFDFADIFYNTEHGVKLDTRATKRVVDAQYGIVTSEIKSRIQEQTQELNKLKEQYNSTADAAEKLKISAKIDFAQEGLDNLYNQLSQYQAFYGEAEKLFSKYGEFSRAQQTANGGDTYNSLQSYLETQESDFEKGLVGTDDFKAYTAIFDEWGRNTLDAYIENRDMIKRYITEDASGMQNFFNDLVAAGYASTDGNGYYSFGSTDINEMAHALHTNEEFMNYMFGRSQDYGFTYDYVSTQTQGELKLQELVHETAEAIIRKNELLRDGASQKAIDEEVSHIEELQERIATVKELMGEVAAKEGKITANEIATAVASIDELRNMYEVTGDDQLKNVIRQMMENAAEEVGLTLKPDLQIEFPKEYEGWEQYTEIPVEVKYKYKPADEVTDEDFNEMKTNLQSGYEAALTEAQEAAKKAGVDFNQTLFGNIDTNNRAIIEWTKENLEYFKDAYESWGWTAEELKDTTSTLMGDVVEIGGYQIAVSPMLQLEDGTASVLSRDAVIEYLESIMAQVDAAHPEGWTTEQLLEFDTMGLIAGLDTSLEKVEALSKFMHYVGKDGELSIDEAYISALDKISEKWKENESTAKGYFDILNEADPDLLDKVVIGNGQYEIDETYERKLEELAEMFGLTGDEAKYLLDIIREIGVVGRSGDIAHLAPMDYKKAADVTAKEWNNAMNEALAENGTGDRFEYEVADKIRGQWDGLMAEAESSAAIQKNLDVLKYADLDVLKTIDFNNLEDIDDRGLRNEADALKELATIFGLTNDEANKLVEILDKLDIAGELAGTPEANGPLFDKANQGGTLGVDMTSLDAYLNKINDSKIHGVDFQFDAAELSLDQIEAKLGLINETKGLIQVGVDADDQDAINAMNLLNEIEGMVLEEQQIKIGLQKVNESEDFKIIDFLTDKDGYQKDVMVNLGIDEENYDEFVESVKTQHLQSEIDMYVGDHSKEEIEAITSENYETKLDLEPGIYSWTEVQAQLDSFSENSDLIDMRVGISQQSIDGIGNAVAEAIKSGARNGFNSQEVEDAAQEFQDLFNNPDAKDGNIQTVKYILETENMTPEEFLALRKEGHDSQAKTLLKYGIEIDSPDWFLTMQTMKEQTAEYKILTAVENNDMRLDDLIKLSETNEQAFKVAVNAESDEESKEILETIKQMSDKEYDLKVAINQESINSIGTAVENAVSNIEISVDEEDVTEATTAVETLKTTIEGAKMEASEPIVVTETGAKGAQTRVEELDTAIDELKQLDPTTIDVGVDPAIYGDIANVHSLQGAIDSLEGKTVTITTVYDTYHNDYHNAEAAAASGTLTSIATAYADGTIDKNGRVTKSGSAYNVVNYKNAYAKGDVALGEDQDALTNELGTESIVFLCDFMW